MPPADRTDRRRFLALAGTALAGAAALVACGDQTRRPGPDGSTPPGTSVPGGATAGADKQVSSAPRAAPSTASSAAPSTGLSTAPSEPGTPTAPAGGTAGVYASLRSPTARRSDGASGAAARSAMGGFGLDMLGAVRGIEPNVVISPYSLYTVLAMARAGAAGRTATQLDRVLGATGVDAQGGVVTAVDQAIAAAVAAAKHDAVTVRTANQVWIQDSFEVRRQYLDALARQFGVQAVAAAFATAPGEVRESINAWVADRTADLIKDLFPAGSISGSTRLVLVNALYLKAQWATPFGEPAGSEPFTTAAGTTVHTPMMQAPRPVAGRTGRGWTAASLGYAGHGLAMTLLVPDAGRFEAVLAGADDKLLAEATIAAGDAPVTRLQLKMPPFRTRSAPDVLAAARKWGATDLFDAHAADLSEITGSRDLYAASFVHQAVISVDQNGTEAAAASGMGMTATSLPVAERNLVVDRPFLYWVADTVTGAPLFLGIVTDPTA